MDIKQIEAFYQVVLLRSFSKAAEKIFLTQPTISAHIISLEKELGTKLFIRSTKKVIPTQAGKIFFEYAQGILNLKERAVFAISDYTNLVKGSIEISASTVPAQYVLPDVLYAFKKEYPDISFMVNQTDSDGVFEHIMSREAEIGITGSKSENFSIHCEPFLDDPLVIITPNESDFAEFSTLEQLIATLSKHDFIIRERGSATRKRAEDFLINVGIDPCNLKVVAQFNSTESILYAVAKGLGIAIISGNVAKDFADLGRIRSFSIDNEFLKRELYIAYRKEAVLSPLCDVFISFIKSYYSKDEDAQKPKNT